MYGAHKHNTFYMYLVNTHTMYLDMTMSISTANIIILAQAHDTHTTQSH